MEMKRVAIKVNTELKTVYIYLASYERLFLPQNKKNKNLFSPTFFFIIPKNILRLYLTIQICFLQFLIHILILYLTILTLCDSELR